MVAMNRYQTLEHFLSPKANPIRKAEDSGGYYPAILSAVRTTTPTLSDTPLLLRSHDMELLDGYT